MTMSSGVISVFMGRLPAMKMTEPYSPTARANDSVKPVSSAGSTVGRMMRRKAEKRAAPRGFPPFLKMPLYLQQRRLHGAHRERHADEGEGKGHAQPGVGDLYPQRLKVAADPPLLGKHGGERDAGDRGGHRKRHVDQSVDQLAARKVVAHQGPGDDEAEHQVDA